MNASKNIFSHNEEQDNKEMAKQQKKRPTRHCNGWWHEGESKLLEATRGVHLKIKKSKMVCLRSLFAAIVAVHVGALQNGMIMTPPMGWSSWNKFHCGINENLIRNITDAIVSSKLAAAGYDHINLDGLLGCVVLGLIPARHLPMGFTYSNLIFCYTDCWMDRERTANGDLQGDKKNFASGMKALGDYIHSKKLLFGLYLDPGTKTCQGRPGSFRHEVADAAYLARVGADYLKHDACYSTGSQQLFVYFTMRDALNRTGRPIGYSVCPDDARCNDPSKVMWDASSVANVNMCRGDGICHDIGLDGRPREVTERVLARRGSDSKNLDPMDIVPTWHSWLCMLDVQVGHMPSHACFIIRLATD